MRSGYLGVDVTGSPGSYVDAPGADHPIPPDQRVGSEVLAWLKEFSKIRERLTTP
jgi:hypothetical protein